MSVILYSDGACWANSPFRREDTFCTPSTFSWSPKCASRTLSISSRMYLLHCLPELERPVTLPIAFCVQLQHNLQSVSPLRNPPVSVAKEFFTISWSRSTFLDLDLDVRLLE
ncbi:hypothetical protein NEAUS07_2344 [Nematocida ausubeli]|nr:hypothetical protein NEAUS07_2344 [Nematocida ausubeli]